MHRLSAVATHLEAAPAARAAVVNRSVTLASNPQGTPEPGDFQVLSAELPPGRRIAVRPAARSVRAPIRGVLKSFIDLTSEAAT